MTDDPPPDAPRAPRAPRGRPRPQPAFDDEAVLSPEEVARRVDVRGGGTPRPPIERAPVRDRRAPLRRPERTGARDSLLLIGLVIVGLVAVRLFLPDGPLTASATPTPGGSLAAVATATPAAPESPAPTGGLITLPPTPFVPTASPGPVTEPPFTAPPTTAPPLPTPTLKPGQTPTPTPRPTRTPTPTVQPSGTPSPPGTATILVKVHIVNDDGGNNVAASWTVKFTSEVTAGVNFKGSESGTPVTIAAGLGYSVTDNTISGYSAGSPDSGCQRPPGAGPAAGQTVICTITHNDQRAHVSVTIDYVGAAPADDAVLSISGPNVSPSSVSGAGTTSVELDSNGTWAVEYSSGAAGYAVSTSGNCGSGGLNEGQTVGCTYTFTEPPPAPASAPVLVLPFLVLLVPRRWTPRRWQSTRAG